MGEEGEVGKGERGQGKDDLGQIVAEWPGKAGSGTKGCQIEANHLEG